MGIFTRPVRVAGATNIFARAAKDGRQFLAYNFRYEAADDFALILPLPTPPETLPTDVRFIDLSGYDSFFSDLRHGFPELEREAEKVSLTDRIIEKVRDWLDIDPTRAAITFAPNPAALSHIADEFQVTPAVRRALDRFGATGCVCLKLTAGANRVPPLAIEFPRRQPDRLFFPTALAAGDVYEARASFNYHLFGQLPHCPPTWRSSTSSGDERLRLARDWLKVDKSSGLLAPDLPIVWQRLSGLHDNLDAYVPDV